MTMYAEGYIEAEMDFLEEMKQLDRGFRKQSTAYRVSYSRQTASLRTLLTVTH